MRTHRDERRLFYGDIFDTPFGDINIVALARHVPIAWHRHQRQDDNLFLVSGRLRVQIIDDAGARVAWVLSSKNRGSLKIGRGSWHGYEALTSNTIVLQFNAPGKWDGSDEERMSLDEMPWDK